VQEQAPAQPRALTMQDLSKLSALFLGLAALFVIISGAGLESLELVLVGLLVMGGPAVLSLVKINLPVLYVLFPLAGASMVSGLWLIFYAGGQIAREVSRWEVYLLMIAGFISLFAAALAVRAKEY